MSLSCFPCWVSVPSQLPGNKASAAGQALWVALRNEPTHFLVTKTHLHGTEPIMWKLFLLEEARSALEVLLKLSPPTHCSLQPAILQLLLDTGHLCTLQLQSPPSSKSTASLLLGPGHEPSWDQGFAPTLTYTQLL